MKIRTGFVSNSSSSSFVINKLMLSIDQIDQIHDHYNEFLKRADLERRSCVGENDAWHVEDRGETIAVTTIIDNLDMEWFLEEIGVPDKAIICRDHS